MQHYQQAHHHHHQYYHSPPHYFHRHQWYTNNKVKKFARYVFLCVFIVLSDNVAHGSCSVAVLQRSFGDLCSSKIFCPKIQHIINLSCNTTLEIPLLLGPDMDAASRISWWWIQELGTRPELQGPGSDMSRCVLEPGGSVLWSRSSSCHCDNYNKNVWKWGY